MTFLRKFRAAYYQLNDEFLLKKLLSDVEPISLSNSNKIFIFSHRKDAFYLKLYTLLGHALSKKGFPSCFLFKDPIIGHYLQRAGNISKKIKFSNFFSINSFEVGSYFPRLIENGKEISNSLIEEKTWVKITNGKDRKLKYDWNIDFDKETIIAHNINFYPVIYNTLRTIFKRYNVDFKNKRVLKLTEEMVTSCDLLLSYFLQMKEYSNKNDVKIRIVAWEQNYIPNGVFKDLCDSLSTKRDIEYIDFARGYPRFFGHHRHDSYVATSNLTYSGMKTRLSVTKKELRTFNEKNKNNNIISKELKKMMKKPILKNFTQEQEKVINMIRKHKDSGKNIFLLFTHLFYDTPIYDLSPAFKDMCEWVLETIEFFKRRDDFLLLKPHPVEINKDNPKFNPDETLFSFLKNNKIQFTDNIFLLKPRLFGLNEIAPFVDCGLIWRSSVALELPFYNIPCIITGSPPYKILDFYYAENKKDYFKLIDNIKDLKVTEEQKLNVARYLLCMKHKHKYIQSIPYKKKIKRNHFEKFYLLDYLKNGDKTIDLLINKMLK